MDRTQLANERTLLAYIRTAIMFWVTGGTILKVFGTTPANIVLAFLIIGVGLIVIAVGVVRFFQLRRHLSHRSRSL